jgi:hypothetical protein
MSEPEPTPEQIAACERAMDGLEAQADIWADEISLVVIIKNIGDASRKLTDRMPPDVREGFINRQEANIDALARQAYLEGFDRGGESRKAYDAERIAALVTALENLCGAAEHCGDEDVPVVVAAREVLRAAVGAPLK